ncbi:MAG: lysostaphin resistance A-like protein [Planctomycetota bacterium]
MTRRKRKGPSRLARYLAASRRLAAAYVFVLPLFALYQIGLAFDEGVRSGTAPVLRELFHRLSHLGLVFLNLGLLGLLFLAIWRTRSKRHRFPGLYGLMFLESCVWTAAMLLLAVLLTPQLLALPEVARRLVSYVGAGIYEEVLFRFLLMGGLIFILRRGLGGNPFWVVPLAVAASAALFSYAHHGLGGEAFDRGVFVYRVFMGVILGTVFYFRGLGIVVYAHALYNVAIIVLEHVGD